eukprot:115686-Chlamydomonas_euryale.AAC.1
MNKQHAAATRNAAAVRSGTLDRQRADEWAGPRRLPAFTKPHKRSANADAIIRIRQERRWHAAQHRRPAIAGGP